jgi:hypothetical protein
MGIALAARKQQRSTETRASFVLDLDRRGVAENAVLEDLLSERAKLRRTVIPVPRQRLTFESGSPEFRMRTLLPQGAREARILRDEAFRRIE